MVPGVRYDSYRLQDSAGTATNSGSNTSLKLYATYEYLPERVVFIGGGQAFNAPRLQDIYISGMHFPGNFFVANPNLKPEKSDTYEAGTKNRFHLGGDSILAVNGTYFLTKARDFISRSVNIPAGTTKMDNLDRVQLQGMEISTLWQREKFGFGLSYGQVRSLNEISHEPLNDTLPDQWIGKFEFYGSDRFTVGADLRLAESQNRVPEDTAKTGGYFVEDVYASYVTKKVEINFRLNNILDKEYRKHDSEIKEVGRDFRLTTSWLF